MDTIKSSADISLLFNRGQRYQTPFLTLIVLETRDQDRYPGGRVAFIAGKKHGNAVWRNQAKRRMRSLCRDAHLCKPSLDIVFLAKEHVLEESYRRELEILMKTERKIESVWFS